LKLCFIMTNFNNSAFTRSAIESICSSDVKDPYIIVVDNASEAESVAELIQIEKDFPGLSLILSKENVGYFSGLNMGINFSRKSFPDIDFWVIGNNDLVFSEDFAQSLAECSAVLDKYPVVSPNIRMLDGTPQNPHVISAISKKREFVYDLYHSSYILAGLIVRVAKLTHRFTDRKDEQQYAVAQEIYQGYGACYILGPKFFEHFSELWAPTFLMYEEFFLSKQLEGKGFKTYYEPRIMVTHHCHASTGTLPGKFRWQLCRNAHKEYRKYVKVWR